jgi:DNA repair exonuclease SbcCD nuclease subunit
LTKFLYTTDWHLCFKQPGTRLDDVLEKQFAKVLQFVDICNSTNPDFILHGGDLFDAPRNADPSVVNRTIEILKNLKQPMYYVPGSHDMFGYNLDSFAQSYLGTLQASDRIIILNQKGIYKFPGELQVGVVPAYVGTNINMYQEFIGADIVVSHDMITTTPVPYAHIQIKELAQMFTNTIFLLGHNHSQYYEVLNNNIFINPGPLVRTSIAEQNNAPYVAVIEKQGSNVTVNHISIAVDKDVFVIQPQDKETTVMTFNDVMKKTNIEYNDIYELLHKVSLDLHIEDVHVNNLKERIKYVEQHAV